MEGEELMNEKQIKDGLVGVAHVYPHWANLLLSARNLILKLEVERDAIAKEDDRRAKEIRRLDRELALAQAQGADSIQVPRSASGLL